MTLEYWIQPTSKKDDPYFVEVVKDCHHIIIEMIKGGKMRLGKDIFAYHTL